LTKDYKGLRWDGGEKTYDMPGQLNAIEEYMCVILDGEFFYSNDYHERGYIRRAISGKWREFETPRKVITICPHCDEKIYDDEVTL
jgi:hypothetical protein